jgi:hypothetical protein
MGTQAVWYKQNQVTLVLCAGGRDLQKNNSAYG